MERLTTKRKDGRWAIRNDDGATPKEQINKIPRVIDRLAAYEDTGLEPCDYAVMRAAMEQAEEAKQQLSDVVSILGCSDINNLKELAQAEKDGRLVVLPCKLHESIFYLEDGELYDDVPYEVSLGQKSGEWNDSLMFECQYGFGFFEEDVGKTVFLTSEEAEAALKKREEST